MNLFIKNKNLKTQILVISYLNKLIINWGHTKKLKLEKLKYEIVVKIFNDGELENYSELQKHAILLVYSLSDQSSFQPIRSEDSAFRKAVSQSEVPVVLVANKVDEATLSRQVEEEDGKRAAKELNFLDFFETAATCNRNVQKSFNRLIIECLEKFPELREAAKKRGSKCTVMWLV